jgi:type I restriction enzyme S subunit
MMIDVKEGWEVKKLGEVIEIRNGKNQQQVLSEAGTYPILGSAGNVMGYSTDYICEAGTTIIGRKGNINKPVFINERFWNVDTAFGFCPKRENEIDKKFVYYLCLNIDFGAMNRGTTIPSLVKSELQNVEIPIPPLPEQQRIVSILDEAFAAIAQAKANAEQNLKNAKELFEIYLQGVFEEKGEDWEEKTLSQISKTFGRGKSKHRPRNFEGLYGGEYPFIQTGDVRNSNHYITNYTQTYNELGLLQSKLWPAGTICITIAANIAETGVLTFDACFPDSVIGIVVNDKLADRNFVEYLLQSFKARIQALGKGSAQANINMGTFENKLFPFPSLIEQQNIVQKLDLLSTETKKLESIYEKKIADLEELKKSLLEKAIKGELRTQVTAAKVIEHPAKIATISAKELQAGIVAFALQRHLQQNKANTFKHVKAEKIVHLVEQVLNIDLDRNPVKDAAGPNDFPHAKRVEFRAQKAGYFYVKKGDNGYEYTAGSQIQSVINKTELALHAKVDKLAWLVDLVVPMNTQQAEIVATVYAAWNNLLLDKNFVDDEAIVTEARENWHPDKLKIERSKFFNAITWMKSNGLIPRGTGKRVLAKQAK